MRLPVVVPLGGVDSERALLYAIPMARALQTELHLVRVIAPRTDKRQFPLLPDDRRGGAACPAQTHASEQMHLDETARRIRKEFDEGDVVTAVLDGPAAKVIAMYARRVRARAIIMTRRESNGFVDESAATVAVRVSRLAGLPVIVIRPDHSQGASSINWRCERIAVALDGSTEAESVLEYVRLFGLAVDAQVTLVCVINPTITVDFGYPSIGRRGALEAFHPATRAAEAHLGRIADGLRNQGLRVEVRVLYGAWPHAEAINRVARDIDADLIAIAARSRTARLGFDSVAGSLLRNACVPVLVLSTAMVPRPRPYHESVHANSTGFRVTNQPSDLQQVAD